MTSSRGQDYPAAHEAHVDHGAAAAAAQAAAAQAAYRREQDQIRASVDDLIAHLYHLADPLVQAQFEPSHLTREWLDSLPCPPGCTVRPEPSSNQQWALVEQWRIAAGTIRYYAQMTRDRWYEQQHQWAMAAAAAAAAAQQAAVNYQHRVDQAPPWSNPGSAFEADVRAEQHRLFGTAPLPDRVAAAAAADAAFLEMFGSGGGPVAPTTEAAGASASNLAEQEYDPHRGERHFAAAAEWYRSRDLANRHAHQGGQAFDNFDEEDDDDEDYEDEEEDGGQVVDDEDEGGGREFSFPIDLAALAKSAGMPFPAAVTANNNGKGPAGLTPSTYEDIVNRLAQAQAQQQQQQQGEGSAQVLPHELLQQLPGGAATLAALGAAAAAGNGSGDEPLNGILSDSSDPLALGPASLPSLMAAISELEQCVARLSLEASEARSLQRRMRDELGSGGGQQQQQITQGGGQDERERVALEKKKARNKKKKDKKRAKAALVAAAAGGDLTASGGESDSATGHGHLGAAGSDSVPAGGDLFAPADSSRSIELQQPPVPVATTLAVDSDGKQQQHQKKEDGELIKALQSVSMLDRRADEYRERLRVLKEQIHHHAALADALAASSSGGGNGASAPTLHTSAAAASASVPLFYDGAEGQEAFVGEYSEHGSEDEELYEEEEEEIEEEELVE
ncbi:hypothetical protein BMF94_0134 [Rhodotorula taiwanensis]|uniref:Uncharacterized protein n=1 Tax=Rhodotorula taiwanensis TaxID=741276 RepID=A0A2S5BJD7_9BASI|nr:hypothetical protein BMF94_0134 [Rhodotorula taiwanensis]